MFMYVEQSKELRDLLKSSESLQNLLREIDSAQDPNQALKNAMSQNSEFEKFAQICLKIVDTEKPNEQASAEILPSQNDREISIDALARVYELLSEKFGPE